MAHLLDIVHEDAHPIFQTPAANTACLRSRSSASHRLHWRQMLRPSQITIVRRVYLRASCSALTIRIPSRYITKAPYDVIISRRLSVPSVLYPMYLRIPFFIDDQVPGRQNPKRTAHSAFLLQTVLLSSCPGPIFLNDHFYLSGSALSPGCYQNLYGFTMLRQASQRFD